MAAITDYSTDVAKVRLLISDIDVSEQIFNDAAIQAFIDMALDGNLRRAAAQALMVMATNETMVQKQIKILDLSTNGPAQAQALLALAKQYREEADAEEIDGAFDWAESVNTPAQYDEFLFKDRLRNGLG
jgi:predicted kinase